MKKVLILIFFTFFLIPQIGQSTIKKEDSAPDFSLITIDGKIVNLYQFNGKVIIIEFLSTKCFACDYIIPDINRFYEKFNGEAVQIIGVLFNNEIKNPEKLREFKKSKGIKYPVFISDSKTKKLYNIFGFPNFFILNDKKKIVQIYRGITNDMFGLLNKETEKLLRRKQCLKH